MKIIKTKNNNYEITDGKDVMFVQVKAFFDLSFSIILLITLSPIFLVITIINSFFTEFKPFFFQKRMGLKGKPFWMIKFRTMKNGSSGSWNTLKNDPRITLFGKLLRKTSMDELPQLFNIIFGEMSFVGPRPDLDRQISILKKKDRELRLSVLPGITGLAQIMGRSRLSYKERLHYDIIYVTRKNIVLDIFILLKTGLVVLNTGILN